MISLVLFTYFSYTVAKERWTKLDFDTTVKVQDHIPRKFDLIFSYLSLIGSAEVTIGVCLILAFLALIRGQILAILGWLVILPASFGEVFGKLVLFHPAPPVFLHRSLLPTALPSFYVHSDFSYPSGHMTRTIFLLTVFFCLSLFSKRDSMVRLVLIGAILSFGFMMALTRIYLGEHWLSDVIGGVLLGIAAGLFASILILKTRQDNIPADARGR